MSPVVTWRHASSNKHVWSENIAVVGDSYVLTVPTRSGTWHDNNGIQLWLAIKKMITALVLLPSTLLGSPLMFSIALFSSMSILDQNCVNKLNLPRMNSLRNNIDYVKTFNRFKCFWKWKYLFSLIFNSQWRKYIFIIGNKNTFISLLLFNQ